MKKPKNQDLSGWKELRTNHPLFKSIHQPESTSTESTTQDLSAELHFNLKVGSLDNATIKTVDGRLIPVLVDKGTRTVYPARGENT